MNEQRDLEVILGQGPLALRWRATSPREETASEP